jgi:hypothetical protein
MGPLECGSGGVMGEDCRMPYATLLGKRSPIDSTVREDGRPIMECWIKGDRAIMID